MYQPVCLGTLVMIALLAFPERSAEARDDSEGKVTFTKDVAPIFMKQCVSCHRPGEVAPMSLLTYEDARPWARSIRKAVVARKMPPWGVNPAYGTFANDISLREDEIATIAAWVDQGARPGDSADAPEMPEVVDGWKLGEPDYIIELPETYVPAETEDMFPTFNVRLDLPEDKWVQAIEFLPGNRSVVHHVVSSLGLYGMSNGNSTDVKSLFQQSGDGKAPELFSVYVAGIQPTQYPRGTGRPVTRDQLMSFNMHYHANGEETTDRTRVGLHFGEGELQKRVYTLGGVDLGFRCPPGDANFEVRSFYDFDHAARILSFNPHMHVRGKDFRYDLIKPNGEREILLDIPTFDYDWQWIYYPTEQIKVPAGSRVEIISHFDNSAENPDNPDPEADVYHRGPTLQEMAIGFIECTPEDGVDFEPFAMREKVTRLVSKHSTEDIFIFSLLSLPLGVYLPRSGEDGVWYIARDVVMIQSTIRDIVWTNNSFTAESTMVMPDGGGVSLLMSGTVDVDGKVTGKFDIGGRPEKQDPAFYSAVVLPFVGSRLDKSSEVAAH